jgi:hypothetical protein
MLKGESQLHLRIRKENEKWENLCWTDPILSSNINTKTKNGRPKKKKKPYAKHNPRLVSQKTEEKEDEII